RLRRLIKYTRGKIAIATIAHDENNGGIFHALSHTQRCHKGTGGRNPAEYALFGGQTAGHVLGLGLRNGFAAIDPGRLIDARQVLFRPLAYTRALRAFSGLRTHQLNLWIARFQILTDSHNGAGSAHRAYEMGHTAIGLFPDFRTGSLNMC